MKKIPIGIENFHKLCKEDYYYVDKTYFIKELLQRGAEVSLFTRPRRFGKSLNMSMLQTFFEIGCDEKDFDQFAISKEKKICQEWMGKFPVISISLKGIEGFTYEDAVEMLKSVISFEATRFSFLETDDRLTESEKARYQSLIGYKDGHCTMSDYDLRNSLLTLSVLLSKYYEKKVIILIDEYDVPLDKANQYGYYEKMAIMMRALFQNALKTNPALQLAVLTGCLRISRESIFTGMNNFMAASITHSGFCDCFGFTEGEVRDLLRYYHLEEVYTVIKEWYDGYQFGAEGIFCPWDVLNYCQELMVYREKKQDRRMLPKNYWVNTSGNYIVRMLLNQAKAQTKQEVEILIEGGTIRKRIDETLTYAELDQDAENIWSILFSTGYLTCSSISEDGLYELRIPNMEIRSIFVNQVSNWFRENVKKEPSRLEALCKAVEEGDTEKIQKNLTDYLKRTISIRDTFVRKEKKENFYHGILLGLFEYRQDWSIRSNAEAGDGFSDIRITDEEQEVGIIIEVKYAENGEFDDACEQALSQIEKEDYVREFVDDGMRKILKYGIAFYKKRCKVVMES